MEILEWALWIVMLVQLYLCPYTKVEESFSLHAIRDLLQFGVYSPELFDHVEFTGSVERSFIGPLFLSGIVKPILWSLEQFGLVNNELLVQFLIRGVLGTLSVASIIFLTRRVRDVYGRKVESHTLLITITQFHLLFYSSRTLPNMLAFPLVQVTMAMIIGPWKPITRFGSNVEVLEAFATLTMAAIIMRLELLAFLAPLALESLLARTTRFYELLGVGLIATILSLGLTFGIDSYFWNYRVWPEGSAILFNVVEGHASDWGISPWHYYFTNALPKLFNFGVPLAFVSAAVDRRIRSLLLPCIAFIILLSCLGHKEWRFLVYIIPTLNACAGAGIQCIGALFSARARRIALMSILTTNLFITGLGTYSSIYNYPGGEAMKILSNLKIDSSPKSIHIDSHSAMTGASLFTHSHFPSSLSSPVEGSNWSFNRSETITDFSQFDYLVRGKKEVKGFEMLKAIEGFSGWSKNGPRFEEQVWILINERNV